MLEKPISIGISPDIYQPPVAAETKVDQKQLIGLVAQQKLQKTTAEKGPSPIAGRVNLSQEGFLKNVVAVIVAWLDGDISKIKKEFYNINDRFEGLCKVDTRTLSKEDRVELSLNLIRLKEEISKSKPAINNGISNLGWLQKAWNAYLPSKLNSTEKMCDDKCKSVQKELRVNRQLEVEYDGILKNVEDKFLDKSSHSQELDHEQITKIENQSFHVLSDKLSDKEERELSLELGFKEKKQTGSTTRFSSMDTMEVVLGKMELKEGSNENVIFASKLQEAGQIDKKLTLAKLLEGTLVSQEDYLVNLIINGKPKACEFSRDAIVSDISHNIIDNINMLKEQGNYTLIPAGSIAHAVLVKMQKEPGDDNYSITLYNTGYGTPIRHKIRNPETGVFDKAKPLKITGLKLEDINNYDFIESLVEGPLSDKPTAIKDLYKRLEDFLKKAPEYKASGRTELKDVSQECQPFDSQKRGTCTYSCLEACLQSHLKPTEMKQYRMEVVKYVTDKLQRAVIGHTKIYEEAKNNIEIFADLSSPEENAESLVKLNEKIAKVSFPTLTLLAVARQKLTEAETEYKASYKAFKDH